MKKNFLKFSLLFAIGFATAIFTSCNQNEPKIDEPEVEIKNFVIEVKNVINSSDEIATVKMVTSREVFGDCPWGICRETVVVAETSFQDNSFSMSLRDVVPTEHLTQGTHLFALPTIATVENINWFITESFEAFNMENQNIGFLSYRSWERTQHQGIGQLAMWIYVDRDVIVKYAGESRTIYMNLDLKKGWNIAYRSWNWQEGIYEAYTTKKFLEIEMNWYFEGNPPID